MNIESLRTYCLDKKGVTESFPFDDQTLVFKVANKIFLLAGLDNPISFNVKCDPEKAIVLREEHQEIIPGYHMNKQHWNTLRLDGSVPENEIKRMIENSYALVIKSLPKAQRPILSQT